MQAYLHRTVLNLACLVMLSYSGIALAEVSDKEPAVGLFWQVGILSALLCLVGTRIRPWLGMLCFVPAAIWFLDLFLEIHSPDVGAHLRLEQGIDYFIHAYAAFAIILCGLVVGYIWHRKSPD
jgi:hypothetical protein